MTDLQYQPYLAKHALQFSAHDFVLLMKTLSCNLDWEGREDRLAASVAEKRIARKKANLEQFVLFRLLQIALSVRDNNEAN